MIEIEGGCHCRAVRFVARIPEGAVTALDCNCSICAMTGYLHVFVPHDRFTLNSAADKLIEYRFGSRAARHLFCATCGVKSFYQPRSHPGSWSVNARCLDTMPILDIHPFDGRQWEAASAALDGATPRGRG